MIYKDLSIYFFDELNLINNKRSNKISCLSIKYISELLLISSKSEFLFDNNRKKYLVDLYEKSINSGNSREAFQNYKHLGDYSLIISGYFTESISDVIGVKYYIDMGSRAYEEASSLNKNPYVELAEKYPDCVSILNELSTRNIERSPKDILKLYNFWLTTKSNYTREKLLKLGVLTEAVEE